MRYSTLHWVESEQLDGPLGYGPSAVDPETGETISGRAYIYGSGFSTYASYGVDPLDVTVAVVWVPMLFAWESVTQERE